MVYATPSQAASEEGVQLKVTHYGASYNGSVLGCSGAGYYSSVDDSIAAVGYPYSNEWPCGTALELANPVTQQTLVVIRKDTCPGCGANLIDLSEAGITAICGGLGGCTVTVRRLD